MTSSQGYGVHFFKVILESTIQKGELKVPTSFATRHWQGMSNPVSLRLPNGNTKKVYWLKRDCNVWLCNGWREFAKYARLDVSHFVVFRYEGNSSFNVIIFGKSALEIEYPSSRVTNEEVEEIDVEIVEEPLPMEGKRPNSPSPSFRTSNKKMTINPKEEQEDELYCKNKVGFGNSKHMNRGSSNSEFKMKIKVFHEQVKKMFHSKNEHFTCLIQKTYTQRDLLILPMEFSKPYLHMEGHAMLFVDDGTTWDVELKLNYYGQLTISSGWRKFLLDNNLKLGDVCAFELDKSSGFSFKVTIYPIEQQEDLSTPLFKKVNTSGKEGISQRFFSSLKTPVTPKASTSMPKDNLYIEIKPPFNSPSVSFHYIKRYVEENGRYVTLQVGNRSWRVRLLYYKHNSFSRFSSGWAEFVKDCGLEEGDTCICKLVDVEKLVFQVSFLKGKHSCT